jgi:predicted nucleic acid-binding protein
MSFDLGVWFPDKRITNDEAGKLYLRLCDGDTSGVVPNPAVDEFYAELTAKHPEIDTIPLDKIDDHDHCPWSCKLDRSPAHVIVCCVWPKATDIGRLLENLARKHGLALYDPQSDLVTYPDGSTGTSKSSHGALWVLGSFALLFAAIFLDVAQTAPAASPMAFYVFAGLCVLMAVACFRQARK